MKPLVSVFMPVYNTNPDELRQAIDSVLNQTYRDYEFVILNDASTNNVEEVILSYKDDRIKYYKNKTNKRVVAVSNQAIELCDAKYIAKLDSDDYCTNDRFEKQLEIMEKYDNIGAIGTFFERIPVGQKIMVPYEPPDVKLCTRYVHCCINNSSVMIRRSAVIDNNLSYTENCLHAEDYKFWCDMSYHCDLAVLPEFLTYYRISPEGISEKNLFWQRKMASVIVLDNMIRDFQCNKEYLYSILVKYVKGEPVTDYEFAAMRDLILYVTEFCVNRISKPFNQEVEYFTLSLLKNFVRTSDL